MPKPYRAVSRDGNIVLMRKAFSKPFWGYTALGIATLPYLLLVGTAIFGATADMTTFNSNDGNPGTSFLSMFRLSWALAPITGIIAITLNVIRWRWRAIDIASLIIAGVSVGLAFSFGMMV